LRPPEDRDAPAIVGFMEWDVVKNLARAPHPYTEEDARVFLGRVEEGRAKGDAFSFAVTRKDDGALVGMCGVNRHETGLELGYWLGRPYWGQGFTTEAAAEVLGFAFRNLRAESVEAGWFHDNPASGRVLAKLGFLPDGAGERECAARGHAVLCNIARMSRADYVQRQAA
jgi:RimJ/RimL family protein N-acetyltransferase